jgi:hypothetical protein
MAWLRCLEARLGRPLDVRDFPADEINRMIYISELAGRAEFDRSLEEWRADYERSRAEPGGHDQLAKLSTVEKVSKWEKEGEAGNRRHQSPISGERHTGTVVPLVRHL